MCSMKFDAADNYITCKWLYAWGCNWNTIMYMDTKKRNYDRQCVKTHRHIRRISEEHKNICSRADFKETSSGRSHYKTASCLYPPVSSTFAPKRRALHGRAPAYMSERRHSCSPARPLSSSNQLAVHSTRLKSKGGGAFSTVAPHFWSSSQNSWCSDPFYRTFKNPSF